MLDLRWKHLVEEKYSNHLEKISSDIRAEYVTYVGEISRPFESSLDWWSQIVSNRNPFASSFFHNCCCLVLLEELYKENKRLPEICIDSNSLNELIVCWAKNNNVDINVNLVDNNHYRKIKKWFSRCREYSRIIISTLVEYFLIKTTKIKSEIFSSPIIIIDTFVISSHKDTDRYYPGLWENLNDKERSEVVFSPLFTGFKYSELYSFLKELRRSNKKYIFKEDYLTITDYIYAISHLFRKNKIKPPVTRFRGHDLSSLILAEIHSTVGDNSAILGLLNYRFFKALSESKVKIKGAIDWWENQSIDKGWNRGLHDFYPDVIRIGYQGFIVSPYYQCIYATAEENDACLLPNIVAVIGEGLLEERKEFYQDLETVTAPAFRFAKVWDKDYGKSKSKKESFDILIGLNIDTYHSLRMIKILSEMTNEINGIGDIHWKIKPHPTHSKSHLMSLFDKNVPAEWKWENGDFYESIDSADLFISSVSSACMEALALGVAVIVLGDKNGITQNPIPEVISNKVWRICHSQEEVIDFINELSRRDAEDIELHNELCSNIRKNYFMKVTREETLKLLNSYKLCNN